MLLSKSFKYSGTSVLKHLLCRKFLFESCSSIVEISTNLKQLYPTRKIIVLVSSVKKSFFNLWRKSIEAIFTDTLICFLANTTNQIVTAAVIKDAIAVINK